MMINMHKLIIIVLTLLFASCTSHNGGDIGPYFGQWKLEEMTVDGVVDDGYEDNIFWKFQDNIICMVVIGERHEWMQYFGTWTEQGAVLTMQFTYGDAHNPPGTGAYCPPAALHLPSGIFTMDVISVSSSRMALSYRSPDGVVYGYRFTKG